MRSWNRVTVGVKNLDKALSLWLNTFGLVVIKHAEGDDSGLNRLWGLQAGDISRQALIATPGQTSGMVHLVEFNEPDAPVREGAKPTDLCPKNLDLYVDGLATKLESLIAEGHHFNNSTYTELTAPDGTLIHEIHLHGHDQTNIVFLDVIGRPAPFTNKGFAGIGPIVTTVPDANAEHDFYQAIFALETLHSFLLNGPEIEKMIGLPPGSGLDMRVMGKASESLGQIEIIEYQGVPGKNLYPYAKPKSLGALMVTYLVDKLSVINDRLDKLGIESQYFEGVESMLGKADVIKFKSPAGMNIEVHQEHHS